MLFGEFYSFDHHTTHVQGLLPMLNIKLTKHTKPLCNTCKIFLHYTISIPYGIKLI